MKDKKEYPIAIMRWSDGLNSTVENAIQKDAERIVVCLNYCKGIKTEDMEKWKCTACKWEGYKNKTFPVMYRSTDWRQCPVCKNVVIPSKGEKNEII